MNLLAFLLAATTQCADPGAVSLNVQDHGAQNTIRQIAMQSNLSIAASPNVRGAVTVNVTCVPARIALQRVLSQLDAVYCEEEGIIIVRRTSEAGCRAVWKADSV